MIALALPDLRLYDAWAAAVRDFGPEEMHGSGWWSLPEELQRSDSRETCAALVAILALQADTNEAPEVGRVHSDYFWITDGGTDVVGFIAVRHALNDFLLETGGHIGYSVRPARRRLGHASRALALALRRAGCLGIERALVTCEADNIGSWRTIETAGGVLDDVRNGTRRYWVPTDLGVVTDPDAGSAAPC